ncbi:ATP-dependent helicase [Candidatus Saccharibacteria bacterium]|nr:ATP-dependent helicase [Candidatus Saccharibacteria bacterium]
MVIELNEEQKRAVEYLEGPLLVLAGPGTGKTQLLSKKVAYILKNTDTNPENILCITFTESGAANMRERLASTIGKDAVKVHINTYHAFGREILAEYSNYSDAPSRRFDEPIDDILKFKIIKNIQSALDSSDILRGDNPTDIASTIDATKSAGLTAKDLEKIATINQKDSEVLSSVISEFLVKLTPRVLEPNLKEVYEPIYETLKNHTKNELILKNVSRNIEDVARDLESALNEAKTISKITPLSCWKDTYFEKDNLGNYRLKDRIANKKLVSLANVMQKYQDYLEKNNLLDFADMIREAINALKSDTGFRLTLSERYQFILLDEFQDTNPSEFEIIKQLTDYENPIVMAVGDDDQAIFEFQGANAASLSSFKNHYHAKVINLVQNYRSTQDILDFSRKIIDQVPDSFVKTQPELNLNKSLTSNIKKPTTAEISRHEFISSDAEYFWVADQISALIKSGVPQKEIAIIAPKHKYIIPMLPYLKNHPEINISYEKREDLFKNEYIHQILTIARFVYNTANSKPTANLLLEILGFDFWEVDAYEAIKITDAAAKCHKSGLDYLMESDNEKLRTIGNFFSNLALKSLNLSLERIIDLIIGTDQIKNLEYRSNFLDFYTKNVSDDTTFQIYESLHVFKEKLKSHLKTDSPKLADLIEFIDDYDSANTPLISTSPYRDAEDSVQVLSAHKSKGLEFSHVFLIAVDNTAWGKSKGNNNMLSLPKNLTFIRHTGATDSERIRLLFVAITRAKTNLYITNSIKDFAGKSPKHLDYLSESNQDDKLVSPYLPAGHQEVKKHQDEISPEQKCTDLRASWVSKYQILTPKLRPIIEKRVENFKLSATHLSTFVDIVYAGPLSFYQIYLLKAPGEPATYAMEYGSLIHKTFERITKENITDEEAIEFYAAEAAKTSLPPEDAEILLENGKRALKIALGAFGTILRAEDSKAEVDFYPEHLSVDGIPITGKIDHIKIDKEQKTIEIYDFKTGTYHSTKNWWGQASLLRYMLQLNFYKLLIDLSPTYHNYTVTKGHILFVNPDKDDLVYDKVYEYNDADTKIFRELLKSVAYHIKTLDFLEPNSPLNVEPDVDKNHRDIKEFIELMLAETQKN